jgi:hypothetical protein
MVEIVSVCNVLGIYRVVWGTARPGHELSARSHEYVIGNLRVRDDGCEAA